MDEAERGSDFTFAKPKSRILAWPRLVMKIFAGLMSRWTMPPAWAASRASAISMPSAECHLQFQRTPGDPVLERHAVQVLHDQEGAAVVLADVVDGADVGMIQGGGCLGLAAEALQSLMILGEVVGEKFESDEAAEAGVLGFVDDAHSAAAKLLDDSVMRDGLI